MLRITSPQQTLKMKSKIVLCLLSLWIVECHGALPVRLLPIVTGQEGENACSSQVAAEAHLNVTKEEIKKKKKLKVIHDGIHVEVVDGPE